MVHTPGNKMVQSDALSQQPDLCPDEDNNNKDIVMLPNEMFINLIDTDLQERIAIAKDLDGNAAEALKLLLEKVPAEMTTGLEDWRLENTNGRNILFYKGKNYIPKDTELQQDMSVTRNILYS